MMKNAPLPSLDKHPEIRERLLPHCRLSRGQVWVDPTGRHRVACIDAANASEVERLFGGDRATLAVHDPPYNLVAFERRSIDEYISWCRCWIDRTVAHLAADAAVYVGDDWRMDVGGARAAGLHPIWIRHHSVKRNWPDVVPDVPVIESLDALLELDFLLAAGKSSSAD